jgi:hypothetical protein
VAPGEPPLPFDFRRSIDLRLDAEGRWFHEGDPFVHAGLIAVFNRGIDVLPRLRGRGRSAPESGARPGNPFP